MVFSRSFCRALVRHGLARGLLNLSAQSIAVLDLLVQFVDQSTFADFRQLGPLIALRNRNLLDEGAIAADLRVGNGLADVALFDQPADQQLIRFDKLRKKHRPLFVGSQAVGSRRLSDPHRFLQIVNGLFGVRSRCAGSCGWGRRPRLQAAVLHA